jgi:hypothetical protein
MRRMRRTLAAALAAAGALAAASPAQAGDRSCDGVIGPETVPGGVVVPDGEVCELAGTRILGSVRVGHRAALFAQDIDLSGNLDVRGDADVSLDHGAIAGNVQATHPGSAVFAERLTVAGTLEASRADILDLRDSVVAGNFRVRDTQEGSLFCGNILNGNGEFTGNLGQLSLGAGDGFCDGNRLRGNLKVAGNRGFTEIGDNDVGGDLTCFGNDPPPVGGGNRVQGNREGQCAAL